MLDPGGEMVSIRPADSNGDSKRRQPTPANDTRLSRPRSELITRTGRPLRLKARVDCGAGKVQVTCNSCHDRFRQAMLLSFCSTGIACWLAG
jgi:hypothetical protein